MFTSGSLQIGNLSTKQMTTVAENLLNINVNYSIDMANQLSFSVIDPGFEMAANNYFQVGRDVVYETTAIKPVWVAGDSGLPIIARYRHLYEISSVSVSQNNSASPTWDIEAMPKAVQQMKRDKTPKNIGGSGYSFVQRAAQKYGLKFVGEKSAKIKTPSKNSGDKQADSVWTVITNMAQESQYVVFVADGTLYFASEAWLLFKWGYEKIVGKPLKDKKGKVIKDKNNNVKKNPDRFYIPLEYPPTDENGKRFEVLSLPKLRKSENDPMAGSGSLLLARDNGVALRPGMTIRINNVPTMNTHYLITSVSFGEQITDPVSVEFRTPERLEVKGKQAKIPMLPIGKTYQSEYFQPSPRIGATAVGAPIFNELPPPLVSVGTTTNPVGPLTSVMLPNARRPYFPLNENTLYKAYENKAYPFSNSSQVGVVGNIDLFNRPIIVRKTDNSLQCPTMSTYIHETVIGSATVFILLEKLWCVSGSPVILTDVQAITKYNSELVHHGIFATRANALGFNAILVNLQHDVLSVRFPKSYKQIWDGTAPQVTRCG